jgi:hypothetical protein
VTFASCLRDEVYEIGREALINGFRRSLAKSIEVELHYGPRVFRCLVRDDSSAQLHVRSSRNRSGIVHTEPYCSTISVLKALTRMAYSVIFAKRPEENRETR